VNAIKEARFSAESLQFRARELPRDVVLTVKPQPCDKLHLFNIEVAATHGLLAAAVYQYLTWHCRKFGQWTGTKARLLNVFPYLSIEELRAVLPKLLGKVKGYAPLINRFQDGAIYTYILANRIRGGLHAFDPKIAATHGILAAVIHDNVLFWIAEDEAAGEDEPIHYISAVEWRKLHPYAPLRSIERAFQMLQRTGELVIAGRKGRVPVWTITLGEGRLDRWRKLHQRVKQEIVNEKGVRQVIYVPILNDPDCA